MRTWLRFDMLTWLRFNMLPFRSFYLNFTTITHLIKPRLQTTSTGVYFICNFSPYLWPSIRRRHPSACSVSSPARGTISDCLPLITTCPSVSPAIFLHRAIWVGSSTAPFPQATQFPNSCLLDRRPLTSVLHLGNIMRRWPATLLPIALPCLPKSIFEKA